MKKISLLFTFIFLISCNDSKKSSKTIDNELNEEEYIDILGVFNKNELKNEVVN